MKVKIASKSPAKIEAITQVLTDYEIFQGAVLESIKVDSGVSDQPLTLEETIKGAKNRAKAAFTDCDLSIAIESGLMAFPETKTGYINASICVIYNGKDYSLGMASGFEYPKEVIRLVLEQGLEISDASREAGLTTKVKVGYEEGTIGLITNGRIKSAEYYRPAIINALTQIERPELFG